MKIRFIFHKGKDSWVGRAITAWTWVLAFVSLQWKRLKYDFSHVEVWIPDDFGNFELKFVKGSKCILRGDEVADYYAGQCFSSTTRGNANGVRFAPASEVLHHPERWCYIECEVDPERLEIALELAHGLVGKKYDYGYVLSFLQPFIVQKDKEWACSEICNWFAVLCGIAVQFFRISPRYFAYNLAKMWDEPQPLIEKGK